MLLFLPFLCLILVAICSSNKYEFEENPKITDPMLAKRNREDKKVKRIINELPEERLKTYVQDFPPLTEKKPQSGRLVVIGGSLKHTGASYLCALMAIKCGAEWVRTFTADKGSDQVIKTYPDHMLFYYILEDTEELTMHKTLEKMDDMEVLVIGPGLGAIYFSQTEEYRSYLDEILIHINKEKRAYKDLPLTIDADGIELLEYSKSILMDYEGPMYLIQNFHEVRKLARDCFRMFDFQSEDEASLLTLAHSFGPKTTFIIEGRKNDKIVSSIGNFSFSIPSTETRCERQDETLSALLGLFSHWAKEYKLRGKETDIPAEVIASYSAYSITRLCCQLALKEDEDIRNFPNLVLQIEKAYKKFFNVSLIKEF